MVCTSLSRGETMTTIDEDDMIVDPDNLTPYHWKNEDEIIMCALCGWEGRAGEFKTHTCHCDWCGVELRRDKLKRHKVEECG